ncbi:MAG: chorismate synthase [Bacteroidetes bacterium GWF2_38_335]|nr:MAG: chorismate synthase [Bacteroidetes bacterium GWF2_38_335]OFY81437.1 MAG: chorismate synthase [Bacteroidetes bacterium RIFOXYA12_FULL_38_20]HBS85376.1 chorismate synthase [Bacteroidales bacterium]
MANTFGTLYKVSIFGESHGKGLGVVIDGCPAGLKISEKDFIKDIERRKPGLPGTTPRIEEDHPVILSGIYEGFSTGAPIAIVFENKNIKSSDYDKLKIIPRPGHSDFVALMKYGGFNDPRGGGHFSGRLTLGLIAAGVIAKKMIKPIKVNAFLTEAGGDVNIEKAVKKAIKEEDSIGGIIRCEAEGIPAGLGEPFFDSVESLISHAVFSVPAIKGIEFGSGFSSAAMKGSAHNDIIADKSGKTKTNFAGGINGGITNGNCVIFNVAVKPTSSIQKEQKTLNLKTGKADSLVVGGRHDVCIALRMPVIIESVTAMVLADLMMREQKIIRILKTR